MVKFKRDLSIISLLYLALINMNVNCQLGLDPILNLIPSPPQLPLGPYIEMSYAGVVNLSSIVPQIAMIDKNSIKTTGFSSGAFMAMQLHVAHSSIIKAAGLFSGGPYGQAYGNATGSTEGGINFLGFFLAPDMKNVSELVAQAQQFEAAGHIDPLSNIQGSNAFIFHGSVDPLVKPEVGHRAKEMYDLLGASATWDLWSNATHTMPTDNFGLPSCSIFDLTHSAINNCNYEELFDMFAKLYPDFIRPASSTVPPAAKEDYYIFNQVPFVPPEYSSTQAYMSSVGFLYIPPACRNTSITCRFHVALHGCLQSANNEILENYFLTKPGYVQVAIANNIIIAFPQAHPHYVDPSHTNYACWDFFGSTSSEFLWKTGPQMKTVYNIIKYIAGL